MKKILLLLLCLPLIGLGKSNAYCDSIQINLISIDTLSNPITINFEVNPNYTTNYNFPYCGLFLFDNNGDTLAYQPLLSGNVYGINQGLIEIRTLEATSNFSYFFSGVLEIVNDWHSGGPTYTACSFPMSFTPTELSEIFNSSDKELVRLIDILGREVNEKRNTPLFYIYNDGTVEKRIVIE